MVSCVCSQLSTSKVQLPKVQPYLFMSQIHALERLRHRQFVPPAPIVCFLSSLFVFLFLQGEVHEGWQYFFFQFPVLLNSQLGFLRENWCFGSEHSAIKIAHANYTTYHEAK